jgi:hypothetical protein
MGFWQGVLIGWLVFRNVFRLGIVSSRKFNFALFLGYLLGDGILLGILYEGGFFGD